ncbi:MAG: hypothetical protein R2942_16330, partial [Ignavibacteria bacterium]
ISDLLNEKEDLDKYFSEEDLKKSNRLKISFDDVKYKFLITYDINEEVKKDILNYNFPYSISVLELSKNFTELKFTCDRLKLSKKFLFTDKKLIFPSTYYSDKWKIIKSDYFSFYISDPDMFNENCSEYLDRYVENLMNFMKFSEEEKKHLKKEKILYLFCKDENEIEKICGYNTKGMYLLDEDAVITTYSYHTHEIAHLLMNYKLKQLPLYTLPFFQEGFAVAVGGRGGLSSNVLMDVGYYTLKSNFVESESLFSKKGFQSEDPSIAYSVSGLINKIFMDKNGFDEYQRLYLKMSGNSEFIYSISIDNVYRELNLCMDELFSVYAERIKYESGIQFIIRI